MKVLAELIISFSSISIISIILLLFIGYEEISKPGVPAEKGGPPFWV